MKAEAAVSGSGAVLGPDTERTDEMHVHAVIQIKDIPYIVGAIFHAQRLMDGRFVFRETHPNRITICGPDQCHVLEGEDIPPQYRVPETQHPRLRTEWDEDEQGKLNVWFGRLFQRGVIRRRDVDGVAVGWQVWDHNGYKGEAPSSAEAMSFFAGHDCTWALYPGYGS
jgi:hypothetical protein